MLKHLNTHTHTYIYVLKPSITRTHTHIYKCKNECIYRHINIVCRNMNMDIKMETQTSSEWEAREDGAVESGIETFAFG